MAGIACGGVWFGGGGHGSKLNKYEYYMGSIIDDLDNDKNGRVNIDTFVEDMARYNISIDPEEIQEMRSLADEQARNSSISPGWHENIFQIQHRNLYCTCVQGYKD